MACIRMERSTQSVGWRNSTITNYVGLCPEDFRATRASDEPAQGLSEEGGGGKLRST